MRKCTALLAVLLALAVLPAVVAAQERGTITGRVLEEGSARPMLGVQVSIPALNLSTVTDAEGRFLLTAPRGTHTLRVSNIGYKMFTRQVTVGATTETVTIELATDPLRLDELVVVGYGTERRRAVAGAVSSLRPAETVQEVPIKSINEILQGRLAGVQVTQNSGTPGAAMTVRIRGSSSINGGNEPLYVLDGVPLNQGNFSSFSEIGFGGQDVDAISDLSAAEIESIEILKDASAAAIYGSRASNGVVLITTKRGISARPEISFGAYYGTQKEWRRVPMLNAAQYIQIYNEGSTARFGPASDFGLDDWYGYETPGKEFDVTYIPGTDTDWLSEVLQRAPIANFEGSVRGGTERVKYYVSGNSLFQEGIIKSMGFQRLNGRVNLDYQPLERLTLGTNVSLTRSVTDRARADNTIYSAWSNAMAVPPTQPVYDENGDYFETLYANPVGMNNESEAEERAIRILGNIFGVYTITNGVSGRLSVGLDQLSNRSRSYDSPTFGPWSANGGAAESGNRYITKLVYEGTLNFNRLLADRHEVNGVVGGSYEDNVNESSRVTGTQFPTEFFKYITSAANIYSGTSTRSDWALVSYFGRVTYTFDGRVTTSFNVRRDGSSRFGTDHRFGTFPSASVMWRVGDESFMQGQNILSNLALRASYGYTGNQQSLGNFASRGLFGGGWNYLDQPGIAPSQLANPDLRWEKTKQLNLGTDFAVLNDRLGFTVDYYDKKTEDLLVERPVPQTTGFATIWSNIGSMENKGFEVAARATVLQGGEKGFNWTSSLSVSRNRNKVTELYNDQPINSGFANRVEVGKPLGFFYGHVMDGIFQTIQEVQAHARQTVHSNPRRATGPGDIRWLDFEGRDAEGNLTGMPDGVINDDDRRMIGSPWPDYEGGITNTLAFRGFDVTGFVQFSVGNDIFNANRIYQDQFGSFEDNHTTRALNRWTPENPNTTEPRAIWGDPNQNTRDSDRFIEDGSYVRLKNLVVGYTLPGSGTMASSAPGGRSSGLPARLGFRTVRLYVQGQNLLTSTKYTGFDPEVNYSGQTDIARGTDFYTLPQARTITFGINIGF